MYQMMAEVTATGWDRGGDGNGWRDRVCIPVSVSPRVRKVPGGEELLTLM